MKYFDVMRQTRTRIGSASEHILNDQGGDVALSEEWIGGATRFPIIRTKFPETNTHGPMVCKTLAEKDDFSSVSPEEKYHLKLISEAQA